MANISKIKTPDGTTYNIKDNVSGYTTNTGTVTKVSTGTGLTGGDITTTGTISLAAHSADYLNGGYLNIQPENTPILIPFMNNDIAFLTKRGGSATISYDGTEQTINIDGCFDGTPSYGYGISNSGSYTSIVIVMNLHKTFSWGNTFYADFGSSNWRAKGVKVEVMNSNYSGDTWTEKYDTTKNSSGHIYCSVAHQPVGAQNTGGGFNKIRVTFTLFNNAIFRIAQLGLYNYSSYGLSETYLSKAGGAIYNGSVYPFTNNTGSIGGSSNYWQNGYFTNINGVAVGSSPKFTDTTYESKAEASGGTAVSLCTTGEKYSWNRRAYMTTDTYPTLLDLNASSNWIKIGMSGTSYGLLPPDSGGSGSGHGYLGSSSWYWGNIYVDNVNSNSVQKRDGFLRNSVTYNINDLRATTRFLYTTHSAPATGTCVAFDSSDNNNYTLQLSSDYLYGRLYFRTRNGDSSAFNSWAEVNQKYTYAQIGGGSSATYYIQNNMRGNSGGGNSMYLLTCPTAAGGGGLFLLRPDTYSTQKMIITTIVAGNATVEQIGDPWGFKITCHGYYTIPSVIRL